MLNYFKALEAASWSGGEDGIASVNLNRILKGEPLADLKKAIHSQVEREYRVAQSTEHRARSMEYGTD